MKTLFVSDKWEAAVLDTVIYPLEEGSNHETEG